MNLHRPWTLVALWTPATIAGLAAGVLGALTLVSRLELAQTPPLLASLLGGAVLGAVLGPAQWLLLRRCISAAGWWVPASILGAACGAALGMALSDALGPLLAAGGTSGGRPASPGLRPLLNMALSAGIAGAGVGVLLGTAQWLVLRREVAGAGRWIVASAAGWPVALAAGAACMAGGGLLAGLLVGGVVVGVVTGATLARLVGDGPRPVPAIRQGTPRHAKVSGDGV